MKTKKKQKKLLLKKITIAQLDNDKLNEVKGGCSFPMQSCSPETVPTPCA